MFTPINPENERIRAQAILRSFTEQREAVNLFAPDGSQSETAELTTDANHTADRSIVRVFKAIKLSRRLLIDDCTQPTTYSPRQVTTPGGTR